MQNIVTQPLFVMNISLQIVGHFLVSDFCMSLIGLQILIYTICSAPWLGLCHNTLTLARTPRLQIIFIKSIKQIFIVHSYAMHKLFDMWATFVHVCTVNFLKFIILLTKYFLMSYTYFGDPPT